MRFTRSICVKHYFPEHLARFLVQQFWRGYWIMKVMAKHPGRPGNDGYGRIRDTIQPPLASAIMLLTPLIFVPKLFALWAILNIAALAAHTPVVLFALKDRRDPRLFFLYPMLYLRSFAWALGCMRGFVAFHLLRQESPRQGGC